MVNKLGIKAHGKKPVSWRGIRCDNCKSENIEARDHPDGDGWYFYCLDCKRPLDFNAWFSDL